MQRSTSFTHLSRRLQARGTAVSIRRAAKADAATVADLGKRLLPAAHQGALPTADLNLYLHQSFNLAQVRAELSDPQTILLLAEQGQQVAGMVKISPASPPIPTPGQRPVELSRLYLNPMWIGQGVGAVLTRQGLMLAAEAGYDLCWLAVWTQNLRAQAFYRDFGFLQVGSTSYTVGKSSIVMHIMAHNLQR